MRHTKTIGTLTAAAVGLGLATAGVAVAQPQGGPGGQGGAGGAVADGSQVGAGLKAEHSRAAQRGRRGLRGIRRGPPGSLRRCNIADDQLLTAEDNDLLELIQERLEDRVADGDITQRRADRIFARRQKMITMRVEWRTERMELVLELLEMTEAEFLAAREAQGLGELLESEGISAEDYLDALRKGRRHARAEVRKLCASGNEDAD